MESPAPSSAVDSLTWESNSTSSLSSSRSHEFDGFDTTWRNLTQEERALAGSIVRLRDQDLSIHLYNAHAMKRRHYDAKVVSKLSAWASKEHWLRVDPERNDPESVGFVPPKTWTAWPLDSTVVPRSGERAGRPDVEDANTFKREDISKPSDELEEIMIAITLKMAKERFDARDWDETTSLTSEFKQQDEETKHNHVESLKLPRSQDAKFDVDTKVEGDFREVISERQELQNSVNAANRGILSKTQSSDSLFESLHTEVSFGGLTAPRSPSESPQVELKVVQKPVISSDDDRSRELIRPSIRHNLSKLDVLLMALHHARESYINYLSDDSSSDSEKNVESGKEATSGLSTVAQPPVKRGRGRPRKTLDFSTPDVVSSVDQSDLDRQLGKRKRGRKRLVHHPLEGESHQEMLVRIARKQKKPLPFTSKSPSKRKAEDVDADSAKDEIRALEMKAERQARLGTRDWSDIIGTAALVGFSPDAIHRAAQRCVRLFGEGMSFHTLVENPKAGKEKDERISYKPDEIPYMNEMDESRTDPSQDRSIPPLPTSRQRLLCPVIDCVKVQRQFEKRAQLRRHLKEVHKLSGEELEHAVVDSDDEMDGAVHIDGFMKNINRRRWRGQDKEVSTNRKGRVPNFHAGPEEGDSAAPSDLGISLG